ncbi:uncharacterized protein jeb isoform X2 [Dermacentor albipictus]|uniref:uncharacterized protein jeb isoform X2 n=1 Tax=Dermacentor albipictus TaxID=60249 RepID=UPI0038FCEE4F
MRLCLMLLGALLWLCSGCEAARIIGPSSSAMREALWWRRPGLLERRESRARPSSVSGPAVATTKGSSSPTASAKAKAGNPEAPGEVAHSGDMASSKAQQSVRSPRGARQYDVPQIGNNGHPKKETNPSPESLGRQIIDRPAVATVLYRTAPSRFLQPTFLHYSLPAVLCRR